MPVHLRSITGKVDYEVEQVIRDLVVAANRQEVDTAVITEEFRPQITQLAATVSSLGDLARVSKVQSDSITSIISTGVTVSGVPVDNQVAVWVSPIAIEGDAAFTWDGAVLAATVVESTVAPGTPPFIVASSTLVANLNADLLDGVEGAEFLQRDGSVPLTADWDAGAFEIRARTFQSDVATGTAPFIVASTTLVANLNADLLDGISIAGIAQVSGVPVDNQIAVWTGAGTIEGDSNFTYDGASLEVLTVGPHSMGIANDANRQFKFGGTFPERQGFTMLTRLQPPTTVTGMGFFVSPIIEADAVGTHAIVAGLYLNPFTVDLTVGAVTLAAGLYIVDAPTAGVNRFSIYAEAGNVVFNSSANLTAIGTIAFPAVGSKGLIFGDGAALSSMGNNTAGLYGDAVGATVEMFAIDEADNATQLTPHNFTLFTPDPTEEYPASYYSQNRYLGVEVAIDLFRLARLVQQQSGVQLIHRRSLLDRRDWVETQERNIRFDMAAYEAWEDHPFAINEEDGKVTGPAPRPQMPQFKAPPSWLEERLQAKGWIDAPRARVLQSELARWKQAHGLN